MRALALMLPLLLIGAAPVHDPAPQESGWAATRAEWNKPMAPFRIVGNVYHVGTAGISAYLITGAEGHILIDGALPESVPQIAANIRALGFRVEDVRILLINHAHFDHAGGLAALKRLTGAQLLASAGDKPDLERGSTEGRAELDGFEPVKVDRVIGEGTHVRLGAIDLVTRLTPGHTRGCTSWSMRTAEHGRPLEVLFACSLTVAGQDLGGKGPYRTVEADFRRTFASLRRVHADVFLNFHPNAFDLEAKRAKQVAGDPFAFVDPGELARRVDAAEAGLAADLARQREREAH
ncbi:MAG: subclass B3 metallo-beta-lactamase [Pseudomonadota bacterium]